MRRTVVLLFITASFIGTLSPHAFARGGGWEPVPAGSFVLPADVCGFPVQVDILVNQEYQKVMSQDDETIVLRITGRLAWRLTNADTGTSFDIEVSGPATITVHLDSGLLDIDGQGNAAVFFLSQDQAQFGVFGINLISGHVLETVDPATNDVIVLSVSGHADDACAMLA
jgi:hypothetical protein